MIGLSAWFLASEKIGYYGIFNLFYKNVEKNVVKDLLTPQI
ncbi:MAG: hypothetical protein ACKD6M_00465 [Candidatus Bathyarchaeota archaeon]